MPNWYTTQVEVHGSEAALAAFKSQHFIDEGAFTFESVIPQPKILEGISANNVVEDIVKELQANPVRKWKCIAAKHGTEDFRQARQSIKAFKETGHYNWYTWCNDHWGTKWDATEFSRLNTDKPTILIFVFNTAWGPPEPVLLKLRKMHPELEITARGYAASAISHKWSRII
jgi:hypothetical protein